MKKDYLQKFIKFFKKYKTIFFIVTVIISTVVSFYIGISFALVNKNLMKTFSSDSVLSFLGAIIGASASFAVAIIALYQSKKANELAEELEIDKRRAKIRPCLQVEIIALDGEIFEIVITNHSSNAALGVYLFEYPLFPAVTIKKEERRKIVFSHQDNNCLHVSEEHFDSCEDGTPKELLLVYLDADNNVLVQKFQKDESSSYNPCEVEYY